VRLKEMKFDMLLGMVALSILLLTFVGCNAQNEIEQEKMQLANPASVHCAEQGGNLEMRTDEHGQYGVCIFDDGSECEEWKYYRGECTPKGSS
jgi:putative hemolysin